MAASDHLGVLAIGIGIEFFSLVSPLVLIQRLVLFTCLGFVRFVSFVRWVRFGLLPKLFDERLLLLDFLLLLCRPFAHLPPIRSGGGGRVRG